MRTLKMLLLSLSVLFISTAANAQENPAQQQHAQKVRELQKQIEKLVKEQVQQQMKIGKAQSIQKKSQGGQKNVNSFSSGTITIIGPDGEAKTLTFDPGNMNGFSLRAVELGKQFQKPEFMIGIAMDEIPEGFHELIGIEPGEGVIINLVMEGTPAEKAGLKKNDLILKLNGKKVTSPRQVQDTIKLSRGNKMKLGIRRGKEILEVELTPEKTKKSEEISEIVVDFDVIELGDGDQVFAGAGSPKSLRQLLVGPGMIMKAGAHNKEIEDLKQQVQEFTKQQAEMKELLESVKELISEQKK